MQTLSTNKKTQKNISKSTLMLHINNTLQHVSIQTTMIIWWLIFGATVYDDNRKKDGNRGRRVGV